MPRRKRRRIEGVRIHRVRDLRPDEVTTIDGLPVTTPARTLLDIAARLTSREVEQALAKALRMRLVTREEMRRIVARHPRHRGASLLRQLLEAEGEPSFTRSEGEEKLLEITRTAGLPRPELNVRLLGHEVDFLWPSARVVAEVDGYAFHASARSFAADRRRDAELTAAGYRVLRFTWADLTDGRLATVIRLAQALVR
jgi:very-short-patch-repair endonuclease